MESSHSHLQLPAPPFISPSITVLAMASRLCLLISIAGSLFLLSGYVCLFPVSAASPFFLRAHSPSSFGPNGNPNYLTQEPKWMSQRIDHFTPQDRREFQQRYYEYLDEFKSPDGPIFLVICGESTCNGISNSYISVLAKRFKAAVVSLEHRYYGESSPFTELTSQNLTYLTSNQALFDLATFRNYYQGLLRTMHDSPQLENPWIVFGISYAGALSAWFQLKFPHLSHGSLASSGVVQAVFDFTAFDEQVAKSAGPACSKALQKVTALVEKGLSKNATAVKSMFGAEQLSIDGDFMYFLADAAAIAIQYGNPDLLCGPLVAGSLPGQDLLEVYSEYVKGYYLGVFGVSIDTYDQEHLKNTTASVDSADRQWWYQVCTEFAYFQVAPQNNSIRSHLVDIKYHLDLCENVFGAGTYPDVNITNLNYGGTGIAGSRIFFSNGSQDPWRHASKQVSSIDETSWLITCHNCGHGSDLRGCPQSPLQLEGSLFRKMTIAPYQHTLKYQSSNIANTRPTGDASRCTDPNVVHKARQAIINHIDRCLSDDGAILQQK